MSGRPLTHSREISEQLTEMNARFEAKTQMILDQIEKFESLPFQKSTTRTDLILADIEPKIDSIRSTTTSISWGLTIILVIVILMWTSTWQGCEFTPIPEPNPSPAPIPSPPPTPGPNPTPIPTPPNPSPTVFQLDTDEMTVFRFAVENHRGETDAQRRASFYFLLGNIRAKDEMIALWPQIPRVELLP